VLRLLVQSFSLAAFSIALTDPVTAQQTTFDAREVKSVFLLNFVQFVEWPSSAVDAADSPIVIGVLGDDPFGNLLDDVVRGEVVKGRQVTVARFRRVEDIKTCHVLFVSPSQEAIYEHVLTVLNKRPTLTVGETATFTSRGMVRFLTERNRIRLEVNPALAKSAGLTISSNLLRAARLVGAPRG
jgi:hypothetical protein